MFQCLRVDEINHKFLPMDFKRSTKKRDIFYLIEAFLLDNGFPRSAECFKFEAGLSTEYTVCDNMSLETIIIEYEIFYHQRFKIYPQLCKAIVTPRIPEKLPKRKTRERKKHVSITCDSNLNLSDFLSLNSLSKNDEHSVESASEATDETMKTWSEYHEFILQNASSRKIEIQWEDIKGADEVKEVLKEAVIYPIKYPHLFAGVVEPWKTVLMYGPPGTGKTLLAHAAVTASEATFFNISSSLLINKWRGDTEKLIKVLFEMARKNAPSIIFFDEIDALALKRGIHEHEASRRMKSELFFCMDDLLRSHDKILVLGSTNTPWDLDAAMLRRFEKNVYVPPPDRKTRELLFRHFLPETINSSPTICVEIDYDFITEMTEKYTGCDVKNISKDIKMTVMRQLFSNAELNCAKNDAIAEKQKISRETLANIINKFKPTYIHSEDMYSKWSYEQRH